MKAAMFFAFALLFLFSAAHAYHHPGDTAQAPLSKPADPIWNFVGLGIVIAAIFFIWKIYGYQKKLRA